MRKSDSSKFSGSKSSTGKKDLYALIQKKAYEYFLQRGCGHGNDKSDWYRAEQEVMKSYRGK